MHEGTIKTVIIDRGFGFIAAPGQPDTFFHVRDLADGLEMDEMLRERRVRFTVIQTEKGPRAVNVCPAD